MVSTEALMSRDCFLPSINDSAAKDEFAHVEESDAHPRPRPFAHSVVNSTCIYPYSIGLESIYFCLSFAPSPPRYYYLVRYWVYRLLNYHTIFWFTILHLQLAVPLINPQPAFLRLWVPSPCLSY